MNNKVPEILFYSGIVVLCIVLLCWAFKTNYIFGFIVLGVLLTSIGIALDD